MTTAVSFIAQRYRYADGGVYRGNIYVIKARRGGREARHVSVGGMVVLKDKALAYAGHPGLCQERVEAILKSADAFAWGDTPKAALEAIRPRLDASEL